MYKIRYFPVSPIKIFILFYKIYYLDIRLVMYFIVLLGLAVGMSLSGFDKTIMVLFIAVVTIYFFLYESIFVTFFFFQDIFQHSITKKTSKIILVFLWFALMSVNVKYLAPYLSVLNVPIVFLTAIINNEIVYALSCFIVLISVCATEIYLSYFLLKKYI